MKAKTMLGLIACASACVSLSAFGNTDEDWFSVSASGTTATLANVSTNMGVEVTGGKLIVDTDDTPLLFTPDPLVSATNRSDGVVTIAASAALTPNSVSDLDSAVTADAKVGIAVGVNNSDVTNYYGYAGAGWKVLTGDAVSVPDSGDTSFKLILDYRTHTAKFYIGEKLMTYGADTPTNAPSFDAGTDTLLDIAAYGSGSISSIDTDFEIAVAAYGDKKYGSVAEAVAAAKAAAGAVTDVQAVDANGTPQSADTKASNGLNLVVCEAMGLPVNTTSDEATIKLESATNSHAGKITLAWKKPQSADDGVTIKFQVKKNGENEGVPCDWDDIQIPMTSGTYTVEPSIL